MRKITILFLLLTSLLLFAGCNKKEFLGTISNSDLFVPTTLEDCQALLDNEVVMNETPTLGELSADNYYLPVTFWNILNSKEKNAYIWLSDIFQGKGDVPDWNVPYKQVFTANIILDAIPNIAITDNNEENWKAIKGAALFARAYAFYNVAQVFAPVYNSNTASTDLGIPIRLHSPVDEGSVRSSLQATYGQIVTDLQESINLLPLTAPFLNRNRNRPCRQAAFAMLARVYLSMSVYPKAKLYADSCLQLYDSLIDYSSLNSALNMPVPFSRYNSETLYESKFLGSTNVLKGISVKSCYVDTTLYNSYLPNDLRRIAFFMGTPAIPKGSYTGLNLCFTGLATDEVYLIRAECQARAGNTADAMKDLNTLLEKRWKAGFFTPFTAPDATKALAIILEERRKELPFRGLRWTDIRRLNLTEQNKITLTRTTDKTYTLSPNDLRYVMLIPPDVINLSGIQQNPR